jgi:hypothetical protein
MSQKLIVKAAPGRRVKDPYTLRPLSADGESKPRSAYWTRRLQDGDVVEVGEAIKAEPVIKMELPAPSKVESTKSKKNHE